jgi:hypothetical protein
MTDLSVPTTTRLAKPGSGRRWLRWAAVILGGLLLLVIAASGWMVYRMNYVPADLDTSTRLLSDQGRYAVSYVPQLDPIGINQIHAWTLHVETPDGALVENAQIAVDGDMPQHGHGLPTRPQVTRYLGNGDYRVEGLKFHMPGWWIVEFDITAGGQTDHVTFNLMLQR